MSARVEAESIKCNARNIERYGNLAAAGKRANVARVAVAGEVVREMWVLGRMIQEEVDGG